MDMDENELNRAYKHVHDMLYNDDKYIPGKYQTKINLQHLINQCNAELFKRYLIYECDIDTLGKTSRGAERIVWSDDFDVYYTEDHYETFELLYEGGAQ